MLTHNSNLFILTGGPGSGKTTVLHVLRELGYTCAPEVARQIIQEQVRVGGTALPWRDRAQFAQLMLDRSIASFQEHTPAEQPAFADRGVPDALGYARLVGLVDDMSLQRACVRYRYASRVFVAPPWEEIYKNDSERKQDFAEALRTYEQVVRVYQECGYKLVELPRATPGERAEFILREVQRKA